MSLTSSQRPVRRSSLPLTAQDETDLDLLRQHPEVLEELDLDATPAEAALLHAIHVEGVRRIKERLAENAYEELARQLKEETTEEEIETLKKRRLRQIED